MQLGKEDGNVQVAKSLLVSVLSRVPRRVREYLGPKISDAWFTFEGTPLGNVNKRSRGTYKNLVWNMTAIANARRLGEDPLKLGREASRKQIENNNMALTAFRYPNRPESFPKLTSLRLPDETKSLFCGSEPIMALTMHSWGDIVGVFDFDKVFAEFPHRKIAVLSAPQVKIISGNLEHLLARKGIDVLSFQNVKQAIIRLNELLQTNNQIIISHLDKEGAFITVNMWGKTAKLPVALLKKAKNYGTKIITFTTFKDHEFSFGLEIGTPIETVGKSLEVVGQEVASQIEGHVILHPTDTLAFTEPILLRR